MRHIRPMSAQPEPASSPITDFYFRALRAYEDFMLDLKFAPVGEGYTNVWSSPAFYIFFTDTTGN